MKNERSVSVRWLYLAVGVFTMLFSGVLYAWSILKVPFSNEFGWASGSLAFNFTLTMCFFCLGAFFGSLICKKAGPRLTLILAGILVGIGFIATGFLTADKLWLLYISYAVLAGTGIGISYNVVVSTVSAWFPDRKGLCSGCLMMGFGVSTLLLGNIISGFFDDPAIGWSKSYMILGAVLAVVLIIAALILRRPAPDTPLPAPKAKKSAGKEAFEPRDYTTKEMLGSFTFWRAFVFMILLTAVGNSVISFARDLSISVGAAEALAVTLVGVLSICNGLGRVITGAVFDALGRRTTMLLANIVTIIAAGTTLLAVQLGSLPLCIIGLCLTGISYGSCPTLTSAFTMSFYGPKYFSVNYSLTNFNLIVASFIATASSALLVNTGSYTAPFVMLLVLAVAALGLNFTIKRP